MKNPKTIFSLQIATEEILSIFRGGNQNSTKFCNLKVPKLQQRETTSSPPPLPHLELCSLVWLCHWHLPHLSHYRVGKKPKLLKIITWFNKNSLPFLSIWKVSYTYRTWLGFWNIWYLLKIIRIEIKTTNPNKNFSIRRYYECSWHVWREIGSRMSWHLKYLPLY